MISDEGLIYMVPGQINGVYFLRLAICASSTQINHMQFAYDVISKQAQKLLGPENKLE